MLGPGGSVRWADRVYIGLSLSVMGYYAVDVYIGKTSTFEAIEASATPESSIRAREPISLIRESCANHVEAPTCTAAFLSPLTRSFIYISRSL